MKKNGIMIGLIFTLLISGCQGNLADKSELTLSTVSMLGGSDPAAGYYSQLIEDFQNNNKDIKIDDKSDNSTEEWKKSTIEHFQTEETTPDVIFYFTGADARQLILDNNFVSLEEIQEQYPQYGQNIRPSAMEFMREFDGNYYSVPVRGFWEGLFCNTDLFDRYQLDLPTDWDSFTAAIETFSENGIIPIAASFSDIPHYWIEHIILSQGGPIEHRLNPYGYVPESWIKGLETLVSLDQLGAFPKSGEVLNNAEAVGLFTDKKAAMLLEGSWTLSAVEDNANTIVLPFPKTMDGKKDPSDIISGFSSGFYITRKAWENKDKRDAAVRFVTAMTSNESIAYLCKSGGAPAADIAAQGQLSELELSTIELQQNAKHVEMPIDAKLYKDAWQYLCTSIPLLLEGKLEPREVITELSKKNQW